MSACRLRSASAIRISSPAASASASPSPARWCWSRRILLLDEPTSALDVSIQAEVLNLLRRCASERKLTYILVSHDLAVVAHMCERLLVMQFGRGVEEMTAATLAARDPQTDYARQLLTASEGFKRAG